MDENPTCSLAKEKKAMRAHQPASRPRLTPGAHGTKLSDTLSALFSEAITVAQLVEISDDVVDSTIVFATPSAAQLFGFKSPQDLIGRYISQIHHPDDALVTRHYTLARFHGEWSPDPYPMRILRGPQREAVPVVKHVRQVLINGVLTWITVHTPFDFAHPFVMPVSQSMIARSGTADEQRLLGRMHVAYMDQQLRRGDANHTPNLDRLLQHSHEYLPLNPKSSSTLKSGVTAFGTTQLLETVIQMLTQSEGERPHHVCLRCGWPWYGMPENPKRPRKCPRCQDKNWDRPRLLIR
jgi:hypothetical protein